MIVHLCPWNTRMEIEQAYKKYEQIKQNLWTSLWPVDLTLDYKTDLQWTFFIWSMLVISHRSEYLKVSKRHMHNAHNSIKSGDKSIKYRTMSVFKIVVSPVYKQWYFTKPPCDSCFEARIEKQNLCTESYRKFSFETPKVNFDLGIHDYYSFYK